MSSSAAATGRQPPPPGASGAGAGGGGNEKHPEAAMNLTLLDPPRWGWTAAGGVSDLLPPHERARRKAAKKSFLRLKRKRETTDSREQQRNNSHRSNSRGKNNSGDGPPPPAQQTQPPAAAAPPAVPTTTGEPVVPFVNNGGAPLPPPPSLCDPRKLGLPPSVAAAPSAAATFAAGGAADPVSNHPSNSQSNTNIVDDGSIPNQQQQQQQQQQTSTAGLSIITEDSAAATGGGNESAAAVVSRNRPATGGGGGGGKKKPSAPASKKGSRGQRQQPQQQLPQGPMRFSALDAASGGLDIHTYHRGREGDEMRDPKTGELLCDVGPTDTNYGLDEPRLVAQVVVDFPLEDQRQRQKQRQPTVAGGGDTNDEGKVPYYQESVAWDLSDPETLSPMAFAADVAENYGLTYVQTMELAESIQAQLQAFVRDNCAYALPVVLKDPSGGIQDPPPLAVHTLYGNFTGPLPGGTPLPLGKRTPVATRASSIGRTVSSEKGDKGKANSKSAAKDRGRPVSKAPAAAKRRRSDSSRGTSAPTVVEEEFRLEVQKRLREESCRRICAGASGDTLVGELVASAVSGCHFCSEPKERCRSFACGESDHAFCETHLSVRLDLAVQTDPLPLMLDYCPICSLTCSCSSCTKKLHAVARDFKAKSIERGMETPAGTVFDGLFEHSRAVDVDAEGGEATGKRQGKKRKEFGPQRSVTKLSVQELPRETCVGVDIDPGTDLDYRTVYSARGATILQQETKPAISESRACSPAPTNASSQAEDGTVDFCMLCRRAGNLVCCDFCPRAYHSDCLESTGQTDLSEAPWKCPACRLEEAGIPEERIVGASSLGLICTAFEMSSDSASEENIKSLRILSMIHSMLGKLGDYEFGYMFREPVDTQQVPHYRAIVKRPMDLGTIASDLVNGGYDRRAGGESFDDIIATVLKDIELVWHNCFTFNCQGSAIYRMATVQSKCARRIQQRSFDSLLSDEVKREVSAFVSSCKRERAEMMPASMIGPPRPSHPSKARHKISVPDGSRVSSRRRPVALLDPDSGMVVKLYTSFHAACTVIELFRSLKHDCEWDFPPKDMKGRVRRIVIDGAKEPTWLLYGYRWVFFDDLRGGKVVFPTPKHTSEDEAKVETGGNEARDTAMPTLSDGEKIEMVEHGKSTSFFGSVEEAVSFLGPEADAALARVYLQGLPRGGAEYAEFAGRRWRLVVRTDQEQIGTVTLHPSLGGTSSTDPYDEEPDSAGTVDGLFLKEDLVTGTKLKGFDSLESAYNDWFGTLERRPSEKEETKTMEAFKSFYLDGVRNVGGVVWKRKSVLQDNRQGLEEGEKSQRFEGSNGLNRKSVKDSNGGISRLAESNSLPASRNTDGFAGLVSPSVPSVSKPSNKQENYTCDGVNVCSTKNELTTA